MNGDLASWLHDAYAGAESGCPPPEAYLEGEATAEDRRRLDEHADGCPACASERELARLFDAAPQGAGVRDEDVAFVVSRLEAASPVRPAAKVVAFPAARPRRTSSFQQVWKIAAALILVLAGVFLFRLTQSAPPALPDRTLGGPVRGGEVEAVSPLGEVAAIPAELRWKAVPGAAAYRVRLLAVDDEVLWEATAAAPPARLPAEVAARLHPAVVYIWSVEALDASGKRIAASEPARFRARPEL